MLVAADQAINNAIEAAVAPNVSQHTEDSAIEKSNVIGFALEDVLTELGAIDTVELQIQGSGATKLNTRTFSQEVGKETHLIYARDRWTPKVPLQPGDEVTGLLKGVVGPPTFQIDPSTGRIHPRVAPRLVIETSENKIIVEDDITLTITATEQYLVELTKATQIVIPELEAQRAIWTSMAKVAIAMRGSAAQRSLQRIEQALINVDNEALKRLPELKKVDRELAMADKGKRQSIIDALSSLFKGTDVQILGAAYSPNGDISGNANGKIIDVILDTAVHTAAFAIEQDESTLYHVPIASINELRISPSSAR